MTDPSLLKIIQPTLRQRSAPETINSSSKTSWPWLGRRSIHIKNIINYVSVFGSTLLRPCMDQQQSAATHKDGLVIEHKLANHYRHHQINSNTATLPWTPCTQPYCPNPLRRKKSLLTEWKKCNSNLSLPINSFAITLTPSLTQKSRKPPWNTTVVLNDSNFCPKSTLKEKWRSSNTAQLYEKLDPTQLPTGIKPTGFNLSKKEWKTWKRTGHGKCGYLQHIWGSLPTPKCDYEHDNKRISHIVNDNLIKKYDSCWNDFINATANAIKWI